MDFFKCVVCGNEYNYRKSLRRHISNAHPQQLNEIMPPVKKNKPSCSYHCCFCDKSFSHKGNLKRHKRAIHGEVQQKRFKCILCMFETVSKRCWLDHFESAHEIHVKSEDLQFSTEVEFLKWKDEMERVTHSKFVKMSGSRLLGDSSKSYYACHRSGLFVSQSKGIRRLKLTGSVKINGKCPAEMKVLCKEGKYIVHFVSTHVGHDHLEQESANTNSKTLALSSDVNANSKIPESLSVKKQRIISMFSDIVNGLTGSEIHLAKRMVISLKENVCAAREQTITNSHFRSPERSHKRKFAPQSRIFSTKKQKSCHIPSVLTGGEGSCDILTILQDEGPNSIHNVTVEEDSVIPWQQELQHSTPGPFSVAMEQDDDTPLHQELQHYTPGPISVAVELDDDTPWQQEQQHCTPGLDTEQSVAMEHSYAIPWHLVNQHSGQSFLDCATSKTVVVCSEIHPRVGARFWATEPQEAK